MRATSRGAGAAALVVLLLAGIASAECTFDSRSVAQFATTLVRAYDACETGPCAPASGGGDFRFGSEGECRLRLRASFTGNCSKLVDSLGSPLGLPVRPCHHTTVKMKCGGIERTNGTLIAEADEGWTVEAGFRFTTGGDEPRTFDRMISFPVSTPRDGRMQLDSSIAEALLPSWGEEAALPPCTQIQLVSLQVFDPAHNLFARAGVATRQP